MTRGEMENINDRRAFTRNVLKQIPQTRQFSAYQKANPKICIYNDSDLILLLHILLV